MWTGKSLTFFYSVLLDALLHFSEVQPAELWKKSLERFEIRFFFDIYAFSIHKQFHTRSRHFKNFRYVLVCI
jgi:hypothetical protein